MEAGTKIPVGLSFATVLPDLDFETYSEAGCVWREGTRKWISISGAGKKKGISEVGAPAYAEHDSTEILSLSYNLKRSAGPKLWTPGMPPPEDLFNHLADGGLLEAHNSGFEYYVWFYVAYLKMGWPMIPLRQLRCSMAKARSFSYPAKLAIISEVIGDQVKDVAKGKSVITRYCIPRNPTKADDRLRIRPSEESRGVELFEYNLQDIEAESSVSAACPDLSEEELANWLLDQEINTRGVQIDTTSVAALSAIVDEGREHYDQEMCLATGGKVATTSKAKDLLEWLQAKGIPILNLEEDSLAKILEGNWADPVDQVVKLRMSASSAGVKKLQAMIKRVNSDGRMRDQFVFYRAITGRFSSEGLQLQNLKSSGPSMGVSRCCGFYFPLAQHMFCPVCAVMDPLGDAVEWSGEVMDKCIELLVTCDFELGRHYLGAELFETIAASMRGMIVAGPEKELICSDYSAIEAVTLSMLSGEQWRIDVFRTHGKIYEMCASKLTGIDFDEIVNYKGSHPVRKPFGKVPELASGYQGWIGAWLAFGADKYMSEDKIKESILQWRADSPMIVELWGGQYRERTPGSWTFDWELHGLEGTAIKAVLDPGNWHTYRLLSYGVLNDVLYCRLPSGRCLAYHKPRLRQGADRRSGNPQYVLSHMVNNSNPKKGRTGWIEVDTYGGMLTENANQAVARDLQCNGMRKVTAAGYPIVAHVHDEIIAEVPRGTGSVPHFEQKMMEMPPWAHDWPIRAAGGWRGQRYRKE
jgi:DNA polymerase